MRALRARRTPSIDPGNALVLGLDGAGKSAVLQSLSAERGEPLQPTNGFSIKQIELNDVVFSFWEVGGSRFYRLGGRVLRRRP